MILYHATFDQRAILRNRFILRYKPYIYCLKKNTLVTFAKPKINMLFFYNN